MFDNIGEIIIGMGLGMLITAFAWGASSDFVLEDKIIKAIAECQSKLPRNQRCEYVITARVKEVE